MVKPPVLGVTARKFNLKIGNVPRFYPASPWSLLRLSPSSSQPWWIRTTDHGLMDKLVFTGLNSYSGTDLATICSGSSQWTHMFWSWKTFTQASCSRLCPVSRCYLLALKMHKVFYSKLENCWIFLLADCMEMWSRAQPQEQDAYSIFIPWDFWTLLIYLFTCLGSSRHIKAR